MKTLSGIAVSPGIAIGEVLIKQRKTIDLERKQISPSEREKEIERFKSVLNVEIKELDDFIEKYSTTKEDKNLLKTHKSILLDPLLSERSITKIEKENQSSEFALYNLFLELSETFAKMSNGYFAERIIDYEDVIFKLINRLTDNQDTLFDDSSLTNGNKKIILIMDNITPSDVTKAYHSNVVGICLQKGSKTSHSAIIARALGIPAVVAITDLFSHVSGKQKVIVDGNEGYVIIDPSVEMLKRYESISLDEIENQKRLKDLIYLPCCTKFNKEVSLMSNIELEHEIDTVLEINSDGVGLYRTEFLFVNRDEEPSEDEQFDLYKKLAEKLGNKELIIRTYDLGGDKISNLIQAPKENNPYLGCRGIRLSLKYPEMFKKQVKAILRAGCYGNISMMFPMITTVDDLQSALRIVSQCKSELLEKKVEYSDKVKAGIMIEVPAAVLCADQLAQLCDFFSIGTNDLVQYTMAADRNSDTVTHYYDPYNPALLKLIYMTITAAHRYGKKVSVCGELASEPEFTCFLISLGVDSLSVNPQSHLRIKKAVLNCDSVEAESFMEQIEQSSNSDEVKALLSQTFHV